LIVPKIEYLMVSLSIHPLTCAVGTNKWPSDMAWFWREFR